MNKKLILALVLILITTPAFAVSKPISGRKVVTTAGTRVQLSATATEYKTLTICAELSNTGNIVTGDVAVVADPVSVQGIELDSGDCVTFSSDSRNGYSGLLSLHYLDSTVSGDGVTYLYEKDV